MQKKLVPPNLVLVWNLFGKSVADTMVKVGKVGGTVHLSNPIREGPAGGRGEGASFSAGAQKLTERPKSSWLGFLRQTFVRNISVAVKPRPWRGPQPPGICWLDKEALAGRILPPPGSGCLPAWAATHGHDCTGHGSQTWSQGG